MLMIHETGASVSVHPLKLSEAIRLGAMIRPQVHGEVFAAGGSCAVGAALEAIGVPYGDYTGDEALADVWPQAWPSDTALIVCPVCSHRADFANIIAHINDDHMWTREKIADWVAEHVER